MRLLNQERTPISIFLTFNSCLSSCSPVFLPTNWGNSGKLWHLYMPDYTGGALLFVLLVILSEIINLPYAQFFLFWKCYLMYQVMLQFSSAKLDTLGTSRRTTVCLSSAGALYLLINALGIGGGSLQHIWMWLYESFVYPGTTQPHCSWLYQELKWQLAIWIYDLHLTLKYLGVKIFWSGWVELI